MSHCNWTSYKAVCHPEGANVQESIASHPFPVIGQVVNTVGIHILDHPLCALAVVVVPRAMATTLFGPQVDHLPNIVHRVCDCGGNSEGEGHVDCLAVVVWEVLVHPEEEPLVLVEGVESEVGHPEQPLVGDHG